MLQREFIRGAFGSAVCGRDTFYCWFLRLLCGCFLRFLLFRRGLFLRCVIYRNCSILLFRCQRFLACFYGFFCFISRSRRVRLSFRCISFFQFLLSRALDLRSFIPKRFFDFDNGKTVYFRFPSENRVRLHGDFILLLLDFVSNVVNGCVYGIFVWLDAFRDLVHKVSRSIHYIRFRCIYNVIDNIGFFGKIYYNSIPVVLKIVNDSGNGVLVCFPTFCSCFAFGCSFVCKIVHVFEKFFANLNHLFRFRITFDMGGAFDVFFSDCIVPLGKTCVCRKIDNFDDALLQCAAETAYRGGTSNRVPVNCRVGISGHFLVCDRHNIAESGLCCFAQCTHACSCRGSCVHARNVGDCFSCNLFHTCTCRVENRVKTSIG